MTIDTLSPPEVPAAAGRGPGPAVTGIPFGEVAAALAVEFPELPTDAIERCVADEADRFRTARIVAFLDVLVHKAARNRLRELVDTIEPMSGRPEAHEQQTARCA